MNERVAEASIAALASSGDFAPQWWLANPHVQSVLPSLPLRRPGVAWRSRGLRAASRELVVDCGEGVRLLAWHATCERAGRAPASRVAVLLHGWEGSADAMYMLSLGQYLLDRGFDVVRLNLRDHGGSHHLNPGIFHSCRIQEVVGAVRRIQDLNPGLGMHLAGFSLGGNFFLRVAARARAAGIELRKVVAVCPVVNPAHTLQRLESGWSGYRKYFVWKWRNSLRLKQKAWPDLYDLSDVRTMGTLTGMTDHLARKYGGYPTLEAYLNGYAVVGDALAGIVHGTRIITAVDDPMIPVEDFDHIARPSTLTVTRTAFGGHCGYYDARTGSAWIEREIYETLESA